MRHDWRSSFNWDHESFQCCVATIPDKMLLYANGRASQDIWHGTTNGCVGRVGHFSVAENVLVRRAVRLAQIVTPATTAVLTKLSNASHARPSRQRVTCWQRSQGLSSKLQSLMVVTLILPTSPRFLKSDFPAGRRSCMHPPGLGSTFRAAAYRSRFSPSG